MVWLWVGGLLIALVAGWGLTLFNLPGNWLMVTAAVLYAAVGPADSRLAIGWPVVIAVLLLAALGELVEFLAGAALATQAGGSKRSAALALLGSLGGGVLGAVVGVPIPIVGSLVGALLFAGAGALGGAMLGEYWKGRPLEHGWNVGKAAFWGRLLGTLGKVLTGSVIVVVCLLALFL